MVSGVTKVCADDLIILQTVNCNEDESFFPNRVVPQTVVVRDRKANTPSTLPFGILAIAGGRAEPFPVVSEIR